MARRFSPGKLLAELDAHVVTKRELARRVSKLGGPKKDEDAKSQLYQHLNGRHTPEPETIERYANALGVPVDAITEEEEEDPVAVLERKVDERRKRSAARSAA